MQKRSELIDQLKVIQSFLKTENRSAFTQEESDKIKNIQEEVRKLDETIELVKSSRALIEATALGEDKPADKGEDKDLRAQPDKPAAEAKKNEPVFRHFGEQLQAIADVGTPWTSSDKRQVALNKLDAVSRAATGSGSKVDSEGGFLIQKDFSKEVMKRAYDSSQLYNLCKKITISSEANGLKIPAIDESSRATGSRFGGVRAYWVNEADTATASKPKLRMIELNLKKLLAFWYATDELLKDAAALQSIALDAFGQEIAFMVDDAIINGVGNTQPLGLLNCPALVSQAKETNQTAATVVALNAIKMKSRLSAASYARSVWIANPEVQVQLPQMNISSGTAGVLVYMPPNGLVEKGYETLFGRPIKFIEQCAALGTVGDFMLVDFDQYLIAEKGGMEVDSSMHVQFLYDEMVFRIKKRIDGQPVWNSALTPYKGSNSTSPYVALATRA